MFENFNSLDKTTAYLEIFILMFVAFLIGYLFARWYYKRKLEESVARPIYKEEVDRKENIVSTSTKFETIDSPGRIKAVKTRDRAGIAVKPENLEAKPVENKIQVPLKKTPKKHKPTTEEPKIKVSDTSTPILNFDSFGKADPKDKDDLKKISGVGPFIEKKLNSIGIYTFNQISKFSKEDIETVTALIQFFPGRILRDDWKGQAEKLKNKG